MNVCKEGEMFVRNKMFWRKEEGISQVLMEKMECFVGEWLIM
jgi:hypothetical protein